MELVGYVGVVEGAVFVGGAGVGGGGVVVAESADHVVRVFVCGH